MKVITALNLASLAALGAAPIAPRLPPAPSISNSPWLGIFGSVFTAVLGALLAIFTFVTGQVIQRLLIEPIQEQRRIVGRIVNALTLLRWTHVYKDSYGADPGARAALDAAATTLHGLAADLRATVPLIPFYSFWASRKLVLPVQDAWTVANYLLKWGGFGGHGSADEVVADASQAIIETLKKTFGTAVSFGPEVQSPARPATAACAVRATGP